MDNTTEKSTIELLFIIPTLNEESIIESSLTDLYAAIHHYKDWHILVVDNGSEDNTVALVKKFAELHHSHRISVTSISKKGRGHALRHAITTFPAQISLYIDADLPIHLDNLPTFLEPLQKNTADLVIGKRTGKRPLIRRLLTHAHMFMTKILLGFSYTDIQSGIKAWNAQMGQHITNSCIEGGYFLDTEMVAHAHVTNLRIFESPIDWIETRYPERKSKVRLGRDSIGALSALFRIYRLLYPKTLFWCRALVLIGFFLTGSFLFLFFAVQSLPNAITFDAVRQTYIPQGNGLLTAGMLAVGLFGFLASKKIPSHLFRSIVWSFTLLFLLLSIILGPLTSQDLYWNLLLGAGFSDFGFNPYYTTPEMITGHPWLAFIPEWQKLSMTHGPLWVLLVSAVTFVTTTLTSAVIVTKTILSFFMLIGFFAFDRILKELSFPESKKLFFLIVLLWNPLLYLSGIIDGHNDALLFAAHTVALLLVLRKKYSLSIGVLLLAGFVKYVSFLLLPIPIILAFRHDWKQGVRLALVSMILLLTGILLFYAPFGGFAIDMLTGITDEFDNRGAILVTGFPGAILASAFSLSGATLRMIGIGMMVALGGFFAWQKKPIAAFSWPIVLLFLVGTPWMMTWYLLWILPALVLVLSEWLIVATSIAFILLFLPEVLYFIAISFFLILAYAIDMSVRKIFKKKNETERPHF